MEDDRNRRCSRLCRKCRADCAGRDDHGGLTADQIFRQRRQPVEAPLRPSVFDRHITTLDVAGFGQALTKLSDGTRVLCGRTNVEEPDQRHRRLLRARRKRPRRR